MNDKAKKNAKKGKHHHPRWLSLRYLHMTMRRMREITFRAYSFSHFPAYPLIKIMDIHSHPYLEPYNI